MHYVTLQMDNNWNDCEWLCGMFDSKWIQNNIFEMKSPGRPQIQKNYWSGMQAQNDRMEGHTM
jgi:hypothetical protein